MLGVPKCGQLWHWGGLPIGIRSRHGLRKTETEGTAVVGRVHSTMQAQAWACFLERSGQDQALSSYSWKCFFLVRPDQMSLSPWNLFPLAPQVLDDSSVALVLSPSLQAHGGHYQILEFVSRGRNSLTLLEMSSIWYLCAKESYIRGFVPMCQCW